MGPIAFLLSSGRDHDSVHAVPLLEQIDIEGGVARNQGLVNALEERLGQTIRVPDEAQLCGALGAALFALERG